MYQIRTLNKIHRRGMALLDARYTVNGSGPEDGVLVRSASMHEYEAPDSLLAVARAGAGVNNIPVDEFTRRGIVVLNTPGANANGVKELVIAGMLLSSRRICEGAAWVRELKHDLDLKRTIEAGKSAFAGPEIAGKTLGVIGLGAVGVLVANAALALGMEVYGYDPYISVDSAWGIHSGVHKAYGIGEVCAQADYLTLHVPLLESTRHMVNRESLGQMKPGIRILNFARDALVDEDAMAESLRSGRVSCYVTDFPTAKTLDMEGVLNIPHLGASTPEAEENCAVMAVAQMKAFLEQGTIRHSVNFPDCDAGPCTGSQRITVLHRNVPAMVSRISSVISGCGLNISDMVNKSRKEWAYTVLDIEGVCGPRILEELSAIPEIVRVRVLDSCS